MQVRSWGIAISTLWIPFQVRLRFNRLRFWAWTKHGTSSSIASKYFKAMKRAMNQLKRKSQECLLGALKNTLRLKGHCASSSSKEAKKDRFNEVTTIQKSPVAPVRTSRKPSTAIRKQQA